LRILDPFVIFSVHLPLSSVTTFLVAVCSGEFSFVLGDMFPDFGGDVTIDVRLVLATTGIGSGNDIRDGGGVTLLRRLRTASPSTDIGWCCSAMRVN